MPLFLYPCDSLIVRESRCSRNGETHAVQSTTHIACCFRGMLKWLWLDSWNLVENRQNLSAISARSTLLKRFPACCLTELLVGKGIVAVAARTSLLPYTLSVKAWTKRASSLRRADRAMKSPLRLVSIRAPETACCDPHAIPRQNALVIRLLGLEYPLNLIVVGDVCLRELVTRQVLYALDVLQISA